MPTWKLELPTMPNNLSMEKKVELLQSTVEELLNRFAWFTSKLDSRNVKRLDTNETVVKSAYGETHIDGPLLKMYDAQAAAKGGTPTGTLRLKMGYDDMTGDFLFELYNAEGTNTVGIDSNGDAMFTGTITGSEIIGSIITGGTLQTGENGDRIVITGNSLATYRNISGFDYLNGPVWGTGYGTYYGDLSFYDQGLETFRIENALTFAGWTLRPINGGSLYVGYGGANTYASGDWSFSAANVSGLKTDTDGSHDHGGAVPSDGGHSHIVTT